MEKKNKVTTIGGFRVFGQAFKILLANPSLIRYAIYSMVATILTFIVTCIIFYLGYQWSVDQFINWLDWGKWGTALEWICHTSFFIGYLILTFFTFSAVAQVVSLPFMDLLSIKVEKMSWDNLEEAPLWESIRKSLPSALIMLVLKLTIMCIALPLLFVPIVGTFAYFLINAYFAAIDFIDLPMGRRGWTLKKKMTFLKGTASTRMAFGSIVYGCFLIPILNLTIIPIASIAGTLLFIEIVQKRTQKCQIATSKQA